MAAAAFAEICQRRDLSSIGIDSAGLSVFERGSVSTSARQVLANRNLTITRLASQAITGKTIRTADLIVTMTEDHRNIIQDKYPFAKSKTIALLSVAGGGNVHDPFGKNIGSYEACLDTMLPALEALADRLEQNL